MRRGRLVDDGTLAELRHLGMQPLDVTFDGEPPSLPPLTGVHVARAGPTALHFDVGGSVGPLIAPLAEHPARTTPRSSLRTPTNPPRHHAQHWVEKVGRSSRTQKHRRGPRTTILMGLDQGRAQITAEWLETSTGQVSRSRVTPRGTVLVSASSLAASLAKNSRWRWKRQRAGSSWSRNSRLSARGCTWRSRRRPRPCGGTRSARQRRSRPPEGQGAALT
jgi:hypothetical protein